MVSNTLQGGKRPPDQAANDAPASAPQPIPLDDLTLDPRLQMRKAGLNQATVEEYAEHLDELPPCQVVSDGEHLWLVDGWHTFHAHKAGKRKALQCQVTPGSFVDALVAAAGANFGHGLRRTNEDKRHAVEALLRENESGEHGWTQQSVAEMAHVTQQYVSKVAQQHLTKVAYGANNASTPQHTTIVNSPSSGSNTSRGGGGKKGRHKAPEPCEDCWRKGAPTCKRCKEAFPKGFPRREPGDDTESEAAAKAKEQADRKANGRPALDLAKFDRMIKAIADETNEATAALRDKAPPWWAAFRDGMNAMVAAFEARKRGGSK